ncbi:hypothetical protein EHF44_26745 (plasmid) [Cupriavidus pauculus]|uniref:Uncharacterized protein n=1 Tax=Cupriavidus pauculus TaxID=82633 RepID=A0A3G8HAP8_9BURK|nr:hypothetical protein EHF44_26745 [Cupriavidus pauculus]
MAARADREYASALDLVQRFRAASVTLLQRNLPVGPDVAESLLLRMSRETTLVRRMPNGLYLFVGEAIGNELQALHGFAREVLAALNAGCIDAEQLRAAADRYGITPQP